MLKWGAKLQITYYWCDVQECRDLLFGDDDDDDDVEWSNVHLKAD